jgi:hypothetical protein
MIGSQTSRDTGWLDLPEMHHSTTSTAAPTATPNEERTAAVPNSGERILRLRTDAAANETPPGADPWDIRDAWDWGEPLLELAANETRAQIQREARSAFDDLDDWQDASEPAGAWRIVNALADQPDANGYHLALAAREQAIVFRRTFNVERQRSRLVVCLSHPHRSGTHQAQVRVLVDQQRVVADTVPIDRPQPAIVPWSVPLDERVGQSVVVEIRIEFGAETSPVEWRGVGFVAN